MKFTLLTTATLGAFVAAGARDPWVRRHELCKAGKSHQTESVYVNSAKLTFANFGLLECAHAQSDCYAALSGVTCGGCHSRWKLVDELIGCSNAFEKCKSDCFDAIHPNPTGCEILELEVVMKRFACD